MSKHIPGNQKHLTLEDRIYIENSLDKRYSFKDIAKYLCKDPTTISKEVNVRTGVFPEEPSFPSSPLLHPASHISSTDNGLSEASNTSFAKSINPNAILISPLHFRVNEYVGELPNDVI